MIGILGGTFDPIHYGHLRSALEVKEVFGLTQIRLIPSAQPPHREQPSASPQMRMQMLELAIENQLGFFADDCEIKRNGPSYMVDTLKSIRDKFPDTSLVLFIGTDAFNQLKTWYQWQLIFTFAHIVVMIRPGFNPEQLDDCFIKFHTLNPSELAQTNSGKLYFHQVSQLDISATAIRNMIAKHQNPGFLLPDTVIAYIRQHKLYLRQ